MSLKIIEQGGTIAYKVAYARMPGCDPMCAIFLSQVAYWSARADDGWVWITHDSLEEQTALSRKQQDRAAATLCGLGILEKELKGLPAKIHYRVDFERLSQVISGTTKDVRKGQPVLSERDNHTNEKITEEITCPDPRPEGKKPSRRKHRTQPVSENPPTLQEWIAYGQEKYPMAPKLEMKKAFDYYEGQGWTRKETETTRVDLTNWKSALTNWLAGWVQKNPSEVARWRRSQVPAPQRENARADLSAALVSPAEPPVPGGSIMSRIRSLQNAG